MDFFVLLILVLIGPWLPAVLFYGFGLRALLRARRAPLGAVAWLAAFAAMYAYALYDDSVRKYQFEARAEAFREPPIYAEVPAGVRTIVFSRDDIAPFLTDLGQQCAIICARLLLSGRFDRVIIPHKAYDLFEYDAKRRARALRGYRGPDYYRVYETFNKGRGIGDCGSSSEWVWDGQAFRMIPSKAMPDCRGVQEDEWPTVYRAERK